MVVGVPRRACSQKSREISSCLERLAPVVQAASIDEFYLDLAGYRTSLRRTPGSDGPAHTRSRPRGDPHLRVDRRRNAPNDRQARLRCGQTRRRAYRLAGRRGGFHEEAGPGRNPRRGPGPGRGTANEGAGSDRRRTGVQQEWLERWFGAHRGRWLYRRMRGLDASRVDPREPRKSISSERTFFQDLKSDEDLERELLRLCRSVTHTLRKAGLRARTITVKLRDGDFKTRSRSQTVAEPLETDAATYRLARQLLRELRTRRRPPRGSSAWA